MPHYTPGPPNAPERLEMAARVRPWRGWRRLYLPGGGDGGQGAAVERAQRGEDHGLGEVQARAGALARQLEGRLVRLGTDVAEENLQRGGRGSEKKGVRRKRR